MGKTETIHDWGSSDCGCLSVGIGVDRGNSAGFCDGAGDGWSLNLVDLGVPAYVGSQAKSCTIALAVLTIYVVDFAINAGWCSTRTEQADFTADAKDAVQSSCRSLIVDTLPIAKQQLGSAWGTHCFPPSESSLILTY